MKSILFGLIYVVAAPLLGGLLSGIDRKITARMQRRKGPPILQPFYDLFKLFRKQTIITNYLQNPFMLCHLVFAALTGFLFFEGSDILLIIFVLTVSTIFLVMSAYSSNSPFSTIGAQRELILSMAYEPAILISLAGIFHLTGSFRLYDIIQQGKPLAMYLPGMFLAVLLALMVKLRKSPFDVSVSHHAHQELIGGFASDFSGRTLAMLELADWYEKAILLGLIFLFFSWNIPLGIVVTLLSYTLTSVIDNSTARLSWETSLRVLWVGTALLSGVNLIILYVI